jgi:hypothetical protein
MSAVELGPDTDLEGTLAALTDVELNGSTAHLAIFDVLGTHVLGVQQH